MNIFPESNAHRQQRFHVASKLIAAMAVGVWGAMSLSAAHAQATNSSIDGKAPTDATIKVHSDTGISRQGTANSKGRYTISSLPPGTYIVSLEKDGKALASMAGVPLFVGRASEVDFACDNDQCTPKLGR